VLVNTFEPSFDISERQLVGDVKSNDYSISLLVEGIGDSLESLLTGCVPNLDCNILVIR